MYVGYVEPSSSETDSDAESSSDSGTDSDTSSDEDANRVYRRFMRYLRRSKSGLVEWSRLPDKIINDWFLGCACAPRDTSPRPLGDKSWPRA